MSGLENQAARGVELDGALAIPEGYEQFTLSDLEEVVRNAFEEIRDSIFLAGDSAVTCAARAGAGRRARGKALEELADGAGVSRNQLWAAYRIARYFPPDYRRQFAGKPQSWFAMLADRTHVAGETAEERLGRITEYAERCFDLNTAQTRALLDAELRAPADEGDEVAESAAPAEAPPRLRGSTGGVEAPPVSLWELRRQFRAPLFRDAYARFGGQPLTQEHLTAILTLAEERFVTVVEGLL